MARGEYPPQGRPGTDAPFDTSVPNVARVYDYLLGGTVNFEADRAAARKLKAADPGIETAARCNRAAVTAAVRHAAGAGIAQVIDLGAGLPTHPSVHEAAREVLADARVAYVDRDRLAAFYIRTMCAGPGIAVVEADFRDPAAVLASQQLRSVIDLREPCAVILGAVLHLIPADQAGMLIASYAAAVAPGSRIVISLAHYEDPGMLARVREAYAPAGELHNHGRADIARWLSGMDIVPPGIVPAWSVTGSRSMTVLVAAAVTRAASG